MKWNKFKGGRGWYRLCDGTIVADAPPDGGFGFYQIEPGHFVYRTKGEPLTAWNALQDYAADISLAETVLRIPRYVLVGMMAVEATKVRADRSHFDPRSIREEPGYISDEKTPHRVSPGLMQTLISTAREVNRTFGLYHNLDGSLESLSREDLFIPSRSIMVGAAYIRHQIDRKEPDEAGFDDDDPVLLCSAYNAGSVRETKSNDWNLLTYSSARMDKFIAYQNDAVFVATQLKGQGAPNG